MVKPRNTSSSVSRPCGSISRRHIHTPDAHQRLISREDLRLITLMTSGMFQNGRSMAAASDILANMLIIPFRRIRASRRQGLLCNKLAYMYARKGLTADSALFAKPVPVRPAKISSVIQFYQVSAGVIQRAAASAAPLAKCLMPFLVFYEIRLVSFCLYQNISQCKASFKGLLLRT